MAQNDDSETGDRGMLEGGGSGGGSERVGDQHPEERGGNRIWYYVVIALVIVLAAFPVLRLLGVVADSPALTWVYGAVLILVLAIVIPFVYGLIKKST